MSTPRGRPKKGARVMFTVRLRPDLAAKCRRLGRERLERMIEEAHENTIACMVRRIEGTTKVITVDERAVYFGKPGVVRELQTDADGRQWIDLNRKRVPVRILGEPIPPDEDL